MFRVVAQNLKLPKACAIVALLLVPVACAPAIGDSCETSIECPSGAVCDTTVADGYCTYEGCVIGGCPDEAICVEFDEVTRYCMKHCSSDEDCREGLTCRNDERLPRFCYAAAAL
jgi:hypothetical protein